MDNLNTEEKIIQAAENEFIEQGYSGARMQSIANKAGINKALLHYYFRSKQKLFEVIFKTAFKLFIPKILGVFERNDVDFFEKIRIFTSEYINLIIKNPHIPGFILHELSNKSSTLSSIIMEQVINIEPIKLQIGEEIEKGTIKAIMPEQLIMNIIAKHCYPECDQIKISDAKSEGWKEVNTFVMWGHYTTGLAIPLWCEVIIQQV